MSADVLTWELLPALSGYRPLMLLDTLKCAGCPRPPTKNHLVRNVNGAKTEEP